MATKIHSFEDGTGYWLQQAYLAISSDLQEQLDKYDVTVAQWPLLYCLYTDKAKTPAQLADRLHVDRAAVTRLLDRLEKKGFVLRKSASHDRRSLRITLTVRGRKIVPELARASAETNEKFQSGLGKKDIKLLNSLLQHILGNAG